MKCTPQNAMTLSDERAASCESSRESPDEVGDVLHLGHLVVVRQDHGVALAREGAHLVLEGGDGLEGEQAHGMASRARERSSAGAECVSAPDRDVV